MPDFTKGDTIPKEAPKDWNLGPTGLRGWMFTDKLVTTDARQISITKVDAGSPADGVIAVGDVLLGVGGKPFSYDPRTEMGKAITVAESEAGAQPVLPHLRETAAIFDAGEPDFLKRLSEEKTVAVREAIAKIQASQEKPKLIHLR